MFTTNLFKIFKFDEGIQLEEESPLSQKTTEVVDAFLASIPECLITTFPEKPMSGSKITPSFSSSSLLSSEF